MGSKFIAVSKEQAMSGSFASEIKASLHPALVLPREFELVCDWMEAEGLVQPYVEGARCGLFSRQAPNVRDDCFLHPHPAGWPDEIASRLAFIIRTGGDGSQGALWLDDDGRQRIVHVGSGSGSTMLCVLTDSPVDMLRLFAIGYEDICWPEDYSKTAEEVLEGATFIVDVADYRAFIERTFGVTIPLRAADIVPRTSNAGEPSDDPFWLWAKAHDLEWV